MTLTYYEILGINSDSSSLEIKKAYKEKLVKTHPDKLHESNEIRKNKINSFKSETTVDQIQEAYKTLVDDALRKKYDEKLLEGHKKQGYHNEGDGLDEYSLDEFSFNTETMQYIMNCPRCHAKEGFHFTEDMLEEYAQEKSTGFQVLAQCSACSLWLKVNFDVVEEYE